MHTQQQFVAAAVALNKGAIFERFNKNPDDNVIYAIGTVQLGTMIVAVTWDKDGKCHTMKRARFPNYDLPIGGNAI